MKKSICLILAVVLVISLSGCETYDNFRRAFIDTDQASVKIGVFEPLTGADAEGAKAEINGIELAHELYPMVNGVNIDLIYEDNQSDAELAQTAAKNLADAGVAVVLGSYNNVLSLAGGYVFEEEQLPAIAATNGNPLVTNTNDYYFRVCAVEAYQGVSAAEYMYESMGRGRVVAFKMEGDDYAATMIDEFEATMTALTGSDDSVIVVDYPENGEDYASYVQILAGVGRSTVFFPSKASVAAKMIYAAKELGYKLDWVGPSKWSDLNTVEGFSDYSFLDGVSYVTDYDPEAELSTMTQTFNEAWKEKYGEADVPSKDAALGFDAYLLAIQAMRIAGGECSGKKMRDYLAQVNNMSGASGFLTMNTAGDPTTDAVISQYNGGTSSAIYTVTSIQDSIGD